MLEVNLKRHSAIDAIALTFQQIYKVLHMRTKRLKDKGLVFSEPKLLMSQVMEWIVWMVLFASTLQATLRLSTNVPR